MPILAREPDQYPDNLLDPGAITPEDHVWFAMYTLSRREKELMRMLRPLQIAHYGPMIAQRNRSPAGRIRTSWVPLFSGYVFVRADEVQRHATVSTGCVSRCLPVTEPAQLVEELRRIRVLLETGGDVRPEPRPLIGRPAVVRSGPMKGLRGTVSRVHSQHRLTVVVTFMQQGASVLVDEADVDLL
jgi:transcription antitermination factor NusG